MARSTYFDRGRIADACPGSESGYAQRFQCGNIVKRLIWTRMSLYTLKGETPPLAEPVPIGDHKRRSTGKLAVCASA
jgi:hypothetical protein